MTTLTSSARRMLSDAARIHGNPRAVLQDLWTRIESQGSQPQHLAAACNYIALLLHQHGARAAAADLCEGLRDWALAASSPDVQLLAIDPQINLLRLDLSAGDLTSAQQRLAGLVSERRRLESQCDGVTTSALARYIKVLSVAIVIETCKLAIRDGDGAKLVKSAERLLAEHPICGALGLTHPFELLALSQPSHRLLHFPAGFPWFHSDGIPTARFVVTLHAVARYANDGAGNDPASSEICDLLLNRGTRWRTASVLTPAFWKLDLAHSFAKMGDQKSVSALLSEAASVSRTSQDPLLHQVGNATAAAVQAVGLDADDWDCPIEEIDSVSSEELNRLVAELGSYFERLR